jgi:hypothetical protein
MIKLAILALTILVIVPFVVLDVFAQGMGDSPFEREFQDIKFLDAYFGMENKKMEVEPGDQNVPFTIVFANVGTQDITGIRGQLSLPLGFSPADGTEAFILADAENEALEGEHFTLTFYVNIDKEADIRQYPAAVAVDYARLRQSGVRQGYFDFDFKVTGIGVLNTRAETTTIDSISNNQINIIVSNTGTAPLSNLEIQIDSNPEIFLAQNSITNLENVVFDVTRWNIGTVMPNSETTFSLNAYIPKNIADENFNIPLRFTYNNAHGDHIQTLEVVQLYVRGVAKPTLYDIDEIIMTGKHTIIGQIINSGNVDGLFTFVTVEPLGTSNIKKATQYIDEMEYDDPVPFNIPIEFEGEPKYGQHPILITVEWQDALRKVNSIQYETTIEINENQVEQEFDFVPLILIVGIIGIGAGVVTKMKKSKKTIKTKI